MADLPKLRQCNAVVSVGTHQIRTGNRLAFVHLSDLPFVCGVRASARTGLGASRCGTSLQVFWSNRVGLSDAVVVAHSGAGWLRVTTAAISSPGGVERLSHAEALATE